MPVIKKRASFPWTVEHLCAKRDGKPDFLKFDIEFKALPQSRVTELLKRMGTGQITDPEFRDEAIVGWLDMKREDGSAWEYSAAAFDELAELYPGLPASVAHAWIDAVTGGAARKN